MKVGDGKPQTKLCAICAEPIRLEARKCIHCASYQNWLGRLNPSVTVLSALTALFSVIALTTPIIKDVLTPDGARFTFSDPEFTEGAVFIEAKNVGGAPATLDWAAILISQKSPGQPYIYPLSAKGSDADHRIQPGEMKRLTFEFDTKEYALPPVSEADVGCSIELFDSAREVSCDEVQFLPHKPVDDQHRVGELPEEGPAPLSGEVEWKRY